MNIPKIFATPVRNLVFCFAACFLAICFVTGCSTTTDFYRSAATKNRWQETLIETPYFMHRTWFKPGASSPDELHVYIEGDGLAWQTSSTPSPDPTPPSGLMFKLMAYDKAPSLYVGRPCYFRTSDHRCDARWWTFQRYHEDVVSSMVAAIDMHTKKSCQKMHCPPVKLVLFGHSGGGTLAVLVASRMPNIHVVVTLAGNLDTSAWVAAHQYLPLTGSLDPIAEKPLPATVAQMHLIAENDEVIPEGAIDSFCRRQQAASPHVQCTRVNGTTHNSGWEAVWPKVLATLTLR